MRCTPCRVKPMRRPIAATLRAGHRRRQAPATRRRSSRHGWPGLERSEEPCVEPESRQDEISQYGASVGVRHRLGPLASRAGLLAVAGVRRSTHAACWACMRTGKPDGSPRWKTASYASSVLIGRQSELSQRRPGELNGRLRPRGDQAIVCDGTLIDEGVATTRIPGGEQILRGRAGVATRVQASRLWRDPQSHHRWPRRERRPPGSARPPRRTPGRHRRPHVGARQYEQVAPTSGSRSASSMSGRMRTPPMVVISSSDSATVTMSTAYP